MSSSRAFVNETDNSLDESTGDQDELSFGVVRTPEDDDTIVERSLVTDLCETLKIATQWRKFVNRRRSLFIDPQMLLLEF